MGYGTVFMAKNVQFYVGVNNIFNKVPPLGVTGLGLGNGDLRHPRSQLLWRHQSPLLKRPEPQTLEPGGNSRLFFAIWSGACAAAKNDA